MGVFMWRQWSRVAGVAGLSAVSMMAWAHTGQADAYGFASGFGHPLSGLDHVLAMLAVGLWSAQLGGAARWRLPLVFPLLMLAGAGLGVYGLVLPGVETGIALSSLLLGMLVLLRVRCGPVTAAWVVGFFALLHGHAHGAELPSQADALAYSAGFTLATLLLHVTGLLLGGLKHWPAGARMLQGAGAAIAATGTVLVAMTLG